MLGVPLVQRQSTRASVARGRVVVPFAVILAAARDTSESLSFVLGVGSAS